MLANLQKILYDGNLDLDLFEWDSLIINRRKPVTYRIFTQYADYRLCLHKFNKCDEHEAFLHPHPWPAAFFILSGSYNMLVGSSNDRFTGPSATAKISMVEGSSYEILDPLVWHAVIPNTNTYTIMINDEPWPEDIAHTEVRTTKGKDLEKMEHGALKRELSIFQFYINEWYENA